MASEKALRKTMRAKKRVAFDKKNPDKEKSINRAISASNKKIADTTRKAFEKNKHDVVKQKTSALQTPKLPPVIETEFDEFGVLVLGQNPIGISVRFPDFNKDVYINKSETPYEDLIEQSLIDLAINTVRAQAALNKECGLSLTLPAALPITNYTDRPFVDLNNIDHAIEEGHIPIYSSVCLNLKTVYEAAYKSKSARSYKKEILPEDWNEKTPVEKEMLDQSTSIGKIITETEALMKKDKALYLQPTG